MEFDGHLAGATDLIDRMGYVLIADESLVGCIVKDDGIVVDGIIDPLAQLLASDDHACGIVGIAQVDHVDTMVGNDRDEVVVLGAGHIRDVAPMSVLKIARPSVHHI